MRTTRNIKQVFSKISGFLIDVRYWIIKNNFYNLPDIKRGIELLPNSYFEEVYPWNTYFQETNDKKKYIYSENKLLNFELNNKYSNSFFSSDTNILKMLSFLDYYVLFEKGYFAYEEKEKRKRQKLLEAINQIGVENDEIVVHILELNEQYVPFTNVFALCCYVLICLDKQGYKLNYLNFNSENKEIWEQIYNKITKNKFVFKIYSSQEEINQKFYKKYLLSDDQNYGVNYGVFANICEKTFNTWNISAKSRLNRELNWWKTNGLFDTNYLLFQCIFNKSEFYRAIKEKFLLGWMFDDKSITKLPKYAFNIDYWKSFFEKIGNLLPFDIPEEDLKLTTIIKGRTYNYFSGYVELGGIREDTLFFEKEISKLNLWKIVDEKLINEENKITDRIIEKLIEIGFINVPKLISKYSVNYEKLRSCNKIFKEKMSYLLTINDNKIVNSQVAKN